MDFSMNSAPAAFMSSPIHLFNVEKCRDLDWSLKVIGNDTIR